ncbi:MAG TPA: DUF3592 domain-containing protein [Gemmatimonadaceae bacterium]|jgi:hypothetical protein|nr:DUF3592 domain-containing protein [Gemmatimonadaceae bacterium]
MGFVDSFIVLGLFLVGLPVAWAIGWVLEKITGVGFLGRLPIFLVLIAVLFGVPLSLRLAGVPTMARVVDHGERVDLARRDGAWSTSQWLKVRFLPENARRADRTTRDDGGDSLTLQLRSTAAMYDRTPVGASVPVTYVSFRPSIAKLSERTLGDLWREMLAIGGVLPVLALVGALLLAVALSRWRPSAPAPRRLRTAGFAALGVVAAIGAVRLVFGSAVHGPDDPMPALAQARVEDISPIGVGRCLLCGRNQTAKLNQPYQVVTLSFMPSGAGWPVQTADAIDSGSVAALRQGAMIAVRYAPATPRHARIEGAQRTFETRNGRDAFLEALLYGAGLLVGVFLVWRVMGRLWKRTTPA